MRKTYHNSRRTVKACSKRKMSEQFWSAIGRKTQRGPIIATKRYSIRRRVLQHELMLARVPQKGKSICLIARKRRADSCRHMVVEEPLS